jgi:hypothetical protein
MWKLFVRSCQPIYVRWSSGWLDKR